MATLNTPVSGLPYPDDNEYLKDVPDFIRTLALALDKGNIPSFTGASDRDTKLTATPKLGTLAWVGTQLQLYTPGGWVRMWPPAPQVSSGSAAPSGAGTAGDIYIQF